MVHTTSRTKRGFEHNGPKATGDEQQANGSWPVGTGLLHGLWDKHIDDKKAIPGPTGSSKCMNASKQERNMKKTQEIGKRQDKDRKLNTSTTTRSRGGREENNNNQGSKKHI